MFFKENLELFFCPLSRAEDIQQLNDQLLEIQNEMEAWHA